MSERAWQLSVEAEGRDDLRGLREEVAKVVGEWNRLVIDGVPRANHFVSSFDERTLEERFGEELDGSGMVEKLSNAERAHLSRTLNMSSEQYWGYGEHVTDDGLYDEVVTTVRQPIQDADVFVLSGLVGYDLLGRNRKLDRKVKERDEGLLDTCILLGGLAVSLKQRDLGSYASYVGANNHGIYPVTDVGATYHGDFYTWRRQRFEHDVVDPLGVKRPFGPALPETGTGAYHSSEPGILAAILSHHSSFSDSEGTRNLYDNVVGRLNNITFGRGGNFADYGDGDGKFEAEMLRRLLVGGRSDDHAPGVVGSFLMSVENKSLRLRLISTDEGIVFHRHIEGSPEKSEDIFTLPNEEIEDYIVALFQNNSGRTSPHALARVLDVIK